MLCNQPARGGRLCGQVVFPDGNAPTTGSARQRGLSRTEPTQHMASATAARVAESDHFHGENFASLLDETLGRDSGFDGSVVTGRVVRLTDEYAIVDVGLKSEGRVALKEFGPPGAKPD